MRTIGLALIAVLLLAGCRAPVPLQAGTREPAQEVALMDIGAMHCFVVLYFDEHHHLLGSSEPTFTFNRESIGIDVTNYPVGTAEMRLVRCADAPPTGSPAKE